MTFLSTRFGHGLVRKITGKESQRNGKALENIVFDLLKLIILQVQEWTHKLRKEGYQLDRQVRGEFEKENFQEKSLEIVIIIINLFNQQEPRSLCKVFDLEVLLLSLENLKDFRNILTHILSILKF